MQNETKIPIRTHASLLILSIVFALSYIDRQVFTVLMEDIKHDLLLNDTTLGLLSGTSFALFYVLAAIPIARYSDKGDRPLVVALCVGIWSICTALCGLAANAWQLAFARTGLAAAEGGAGPAIMSLILELYPKSKRTLVIGILMAANSIGISGGLYIGGLLSQYYDWRTVFIIVGIPGLLIAALVWFWCVEPRRNVKKQNIEETNVQEPKISTWNILKSMAKSKSLVYSGLAFVFVAITGFGLIMWSPSFLIRVHGLSKVETGAWLGLATLIGLVAGNVSSGWFVDKFGKGDAKFTGNYSAIALLISLPFVIGFGLSKDATIALFCFAGFKFFITLYFAPLQAICFNQVPLNMRATMSAVINMLVSLAGVGLGTFLVGFISDNFIARYGDQSLRYAVVVISLGLVIGAFSAWRAGHTAQVVHEE